MLGWRLFLGPILIAALVGLFALDAHFGKTRRLPPLWVLALPLDLPQLVGSFRRSF